MNIFKPPVIIENNKKKEYSKSLILKKKKGFRSKLVFHLAEYPTLL